MTMTVSDNTPRVQITAGAAQTSFSINFEFRLATDLKVYVNNSLKTLNVDYTIAGAGVSGGGTMTWIGTAMVGGEIVVIYRDMPIARTSEEYATGGQLPGLTLEASLDDATMRSQQLERDIGRALRLAPADTSDAGAFLLPIASGRINKFLRFNGTGLPELVEFVTLAFDNAIFVTTVGGSVDAITLTPSPAETAYVTGRTFRFVASGANTGAVTVNISGLGVKSITKNGAVALVAGDIASGAIVTITYDGTQFQMLTTIIPLTIRVDTIQLGHDSDTTIDRGSPGVMRIEGQNVMTLATSDARYVRQGLETIPIVAGSMQPATTNGASPADLETVTNRVLYRTLDFDQTTQEFAGFVIPMPKGWNDGTVTFQPIWTASAGAGGVVWALQGVAISNDDPIEVAYGTEQTSADTLIALGDVHVGPTSAAITIAGTPANDDLIAFRIKRVPADGADTLTGDARLIGLRLFFTRNVADDT